jgi:DNA-binding transcriptional LysR family regulator
VKAFTAKCSLPMVARLGFAIDIARVSRGRCNIDDGPTSHPLGSQRHLFYICRNHPFLDGNKRAALAACLVFLENNGLLPDRKLPINDWEQFVLDVASSKINRDETTRRLRKLLKKFRRS